MALNRDPHRDFVSSICPGREGWNLYVKIVRLWSVPDLNGQKLPYSMEMVLMDERGDKIHAHIRRSLMYRFEQDLREGSVYFMHFFEVVPNNKTLKTTKHDYRLYFQYTTKVAEVIG